MKERAQIFCVLCNCSNPGNIGAAARAIKNMGLKGLILVCPKQGFWLEAVKMAHGALDVLEKATIFDSIKDALSDIHFVIGTTRRQRKYRSITYSPREACQEIMHFPPKYKIAILFGAEKTGLTNYELSFCQRIVVIPTSPSFGSINLAQAVMIMSYEWHMANMERDLDFKLADKTRGIGMSETSLNKGYKHAVLPNMDQRQRLIEHTERVLKRIGFIKMNPENMRLTLIDMLSRMDPDEREIAILRGILRKTEYLLDKK